MEYQKISEAVSEPFSENLKKLQELFPSVVKDGEVDFDALRAELGEFTEVGKERYELTWAGKQDAQILTGEPLVGKTLKYVAEESKNPETTENLYIEGDNLEALKLLQNSYRGKIKMIYIDPPYNTGEDFIYQDRRFQTQVESDIAEGARSEDGERLVLNPETSARYHANWLSMMYPRLRLARDLLQDDGVIFISIDDNEVYNLRKICSEIFGVDNFIGTILWKKKTNGNNMGIIPSVHDYILAYAKSIENIGDIGYQVTEEYINKKYENPDNDPRGDWTTSDLSGNHKGPYFAITNPLTGEIFYPPEGRYWVFNEEDVKRRIADGRIIFGKTGRSRPVQKVFAQDRIKGRIRAESWWDKHGMNEDATNEIRELFGKGKLFTHPKPSKLLCNIVNISTFNNDTILDFFSGSSTTAHAVMQLNAEDGGNRKFIMVQFPEVCDEKSEAYNAGYKTISELGKERIRRAGEKIKAEHPEVDVGFKVFKVDDTNIRWIAAESGKQGVTLEDALSAGGKDLRDFMNGTNDIDVVYEILIRQYGIPLTAPIDLLSDIGERTYSIADTVIVCLEGDVTDAVVDKIANLEPIPQKIVFRDSAFGDNISLKENAMLRLDALMQKHAVGGRQPYSIEFL